MVKKKKKRSPISISTTGKCKISRIFALHLFYSFNSNFWKVLIKYKYMFPKLHTRALFYFYYINNWTLWGILGILITLNYLFHLQCFILAKFIVFSYLLLLFNLVVFRFLGMITQFFVNSFDYLSHNHIIIYYNIVVRAVQRFEKCHVCFCPLLKLHLRLGN